MHKYLVELYLNDENGNPKGRDGFQYFDSEINLQAYYEEKRNGNEEDEVDYEELLERIEGGTFRENDWGYDEEQDVNSDDDRDLKDMNLKQLEALSGLEGDCSEIDDHLINVVTTMNEMTTFQSTIKVREVRSVNRRS